MKERIALLEAENASLLDELEAIYRQVEEHLSASRHEREIAYQGLRDRNRELQHRLEELERTNRELQETQRMLVRSERLAAMGEMAAAIVHEIKNPLTVIIGRAQLMAMSEVPDRKDLESLLKSGDYLRTLIENVLGFARNHRANRPTSI
jgi:signal transduction histidine kinase